MLSGAAHARDRGILGFGAIASNDIIGDGEDRWRTGSYTASYAGGRAWQGRLPRRPGALMEYRLHAEVISPERLSRRVPGDRPLVGIAAFGAHTHFEIGGWETSLGGDLVFTGPQTGLAALQGRLHKATRGSTSRILETQLGNALYPSARAETARRIAFGPGTLRPFAEAAAGAETYLRLGADLHIGGLEDGALFMRDGVSGHRYPVIFAREKQGLSFVAGGDIARVHGSVYLPAARGALPKADRWRWRAGLLYGRRSTGPEAIWLFTGLSRLGPEFEGQREAQTIGSISLNLRF